MRPLRGHLAEVEPVVAHAGVALCDGLRVPDAGLADLDEMPAAAADQPQAGRDELAGQGVQHHVHALAGRGREDVVDKGERA